MMQNERLNYYDLMDKLDKFCINYQDFDFRELKVYVNKHNGKELLFIKDKDGCVLAIYVIK